MAYATILKLMFKINEGHILEEVILKMDHPIPTYNHFSHFSLAHAVPAQQLAVKWGSKCHHRQLLVSIIPKTTPCPTEGRDRKQLC